MNMYLVVTLLIDNPCSQVVNLRLMLLLLDVPLLSNAIPNLTFAKHKTQYEIGLMSNLSQNFNFDLFFNSMKFHMGFRSHP